MDDAFLAPHAPRRAEAPRSDALEVREPAHREQHWDRPRERLRSHGAAALSLSELLALVLRTGSRGTPAPQLAARLLEKFPSLEAIARAGDAELAQAAT